MEITRPCRKCGGKHRVFYFEKHRRLHLVMLCGDRRIFVPFEKGLPVEIVHSRSAQYIEEHNRELDAERETAVLKDKK